MTEPIFPIPAAAVRNAQAELRPLAGGIDHPECVAWFEGRVYCGTESGQVLAIDPGTGETSVVATRSGSSRRSGSWRSGRVEGPW